MIIARRTLTLKANGGDREVPVDLYAPVEGDGAWSCRFEIGWPTGSTVGEGRGFDGMQAVYLAMQKIAVLLYASPQHAAGALSWGKPGAGYGFPMPKVGRDQLVGEDRLAQL